MKRWRVEATFDGRWIVLTPEGKGYLFANWRTAYDTALAEASR